MNNTTLGNSITKYIKFEGKLYALVETVPSNDVDVACNAILVEKKMIFNPNRLDGNGTFWGGHISSPIFTCTNSTPDCCFNATVGERDLGSQTNERNHRFQTTEIDVCSQSGDTKGSYADRGIHKIMYDMLKILDLPGLHISFNGISQKYEISIGKYKFIQQ